MNKKKTGLVSILSLVVLVTLTVTMGGQPKKTIKKLPYTEEELMTPTVRDTYTGDHLREIRFPIGGVGAGCIALNGKGALVDWEVGDRPNAQTRVVFQNDAGQIFARSVIDGTLIASGSDASHVIQKAIDSLPVTGGRIYIAAGSYQLTDTIRIEDKHGVHLEGAARGITFSGGNEGTSLRSKEAIDLLHIHGGKLKIAGVTVSNLHFVGSGKDNGKAGVLVTGNSDLLSLHQVGANNCGVGFHFKGGGPGAGVIDAPQIQFCDPQVNGIGLKIEHSHYAKVVGGEFSDCDQYGIMLSSSDAGHRRSCGVKVIGVTAVRNGDGGILVGSNTDCITVTGGCDFGGSPRGSGVVVANDQGGRAPHNIIISNVHAYNNKHAGVHVKQGQHVVIAQCICSGHDHVAVHNHGQPYGIDVGPDAENVVISANITHSNGKQGIRLESKNAK